MMNDNAGLRVTAKTGRGLFSSDAKAHTWNRKARACGVWCEAFASQTAKDHGKSPPFVPLHHVMTVIFRRVQYKHFDFTMRHA